MNAEKTTELIKVLQERFAKNPKRHPGITWSLVEQRLSAHPAKLPSLGEMESSGGEPDVIGVDSATGEVIFCDCAAESPAGRRSLCYDQVALDARKENKPSGAALDKAVSWGIELLSEAQYRALQELGEFDRKTSSWVATPAETRALGGALFCDRRYNRVFVYHNGADSYYGARGFRGRLPV